MSFRLQRNLTLLVLSLLFFWGFFLGYALYDRFHVEQNENNSQQSEPRGWHGHRL